MKSVLLIRHTKSDWSAGLPDFDRTIRKDREEDAKIIAKEVRNRGYHPDYVACSPAKRTIQTAKIICGGWDYNFSTVVQDKSLYESSHREILAHIQKIGKPFSNAVIICHNPSITDFVNRYSDRDIDNVPTTGAVLIPLTLTNGAV